MDNIKKPFILKSLLYACVGVKSPYHQRPFIRKNKELLTVGKLEALAYVKHRNGKRASREKLPTKKEKTK